MRARRRRGFSLLEVMITSAMLLIGITGLIAGVHVATRQQEHNRRVANALIIAEHRLEELLLLFPTSLALTDGRHPETGFELFSESGVRDAGDDFRLFYDVSFASPPDAEPDDRLPGVVLEVTIAWDETTGERNLSLRTVR
jgi:prepilin-type N-terminal cleavage/methylation domain-containing protein